MSRLLAGLGLDPVAGGRFVNGLERRDRSPQEVCELALSCVVKVRDQPVDRLPMRQARVWSDRGVGREKHLTEV